MKVKKIIIFKILEAFLFLTICFLFLTCEKEKVAIKTYQNVDRKLWPYFQKFEEEGNARGLDIDLSNSNISGDIININFNGVVGVCLKESEIPNKILLDTAFWNRSSNLVKELIIFHELGHCYLGRSHSDEVASSGFCASIMRSGRSGCLDHYNSKTRSKLLDELFLE
jgi:hypothetical protein